MEDVPNVGDEGEIWMKGPIIMKGVSLIDRLCLTMSAHTRRFLAAVP